MTNTYTSIDQLPITLCAEDVAQVLGISRAGAYTLMHSKGFPTIQIGKRMVVPKDKLLAWMEEQSAASRRECRCNLLKFCERKSNSASSII